MISQQPNKSHLTHLSLRKVAELLDVSISTVRRLIGDGDLIAQKVGGQLRVSLANLQTFVQRSTHDPNSSEQP